MSPEQLRFGLVATGAFIDINNCKTRPGQFCRKVGFRELLKPLFNLISVTTG